MLWRGGGRAHSVCGMRSGRLLGGAFATLAMLALGACGGVPHPATQDIGEAHAATPAAARWPDEARYALHVASAPRRFALAGTERIAFRNVGPDTLTSVWVRAWANAFGGCAAHRAPVAVTGGGTAWARRRDAGGAEAVVHGARGASGDAARLRRRDDDRAAHPHHGPAAARPLRALPRRGLLRQRDTAPRGRRPPRVAASAVHLRRRELLLAHVRVARAAARAGRPAGRLDRHAGRRPARRRGHARRAPRA